MEFKGTKGKWYLQNRSDAYTNIVRCDNGVNDSLFIASTPQNSREEIRYNALLISKAPEMLEMLKWLYSRLGTSFSQEKEEIEQLIKEATDI